MTSYDATGLKSYVQLCTAVYRALNILKLSKFMVDIIKNQKVKSWLG